MCVKAVDLIFENCEVITIKKGDIGELHIGDVRTEICSISGSEIKPDVKAGKIALEIYKWRNSDYFPFGMKKLKTCVFERIAAGDITHVDLIHETGRVDSFEVDYHEGDGCGVANRNQSVYLSKKGNLLITIGEGVTLEDAFCQETVKGASAYERKGHNDDGAVEHILSEECLPDMYRHVYLRGKNGKTALAVRVADQNAGWRFVFARPECAIHLPESWKYPEQKERGALNAAFDVSLVRALYPETQYSAVGC